MVEWPMPKFRFMVKSALLDDCLFSEISGLDTEVAPVDYWIGNDMEFSAVKMPSMNKNSNVTLKRGMALNEKSINQWKQSIQSGEINRETITITLQDESGKPVMTWALQNAFPVKITAAASNSDGNHTAIEELELAHEGFILEKG